MLKGYLGSILRELAFIYFSREKSKDLLYPQRKGGAKRRKTFKRLLRIYTLKLEIFALEKI